MFSILDLVFAFIVAITFVGMFRLQRKFFSKKYFELSRRVFGRGITKRMILLRIVIIFLFSALAYFLIADSNTILLGVLLGSFLIVWPVLLNPSQFDLEEFGDWGQSKVKMNKKGWFFLLFSYFLFISTSVIVAYLSINYSENILFLSTESFKSWALGNFWLIIVAILGYPVSERTENYLEQDIRKRQEEILEYYDVNE